MQTVSSTYRYILIAADPLVPAYRPWNSQHHHNYRRWIKTNEEVQKSQSKGPGDQQIVHNNAVPSPQPHGTSGHTTILVIVKVAHLIAQHERRYKKSTW